jgi:hypothetical protein
MYRPENPNLKHDDNKRRKPMNKIFKETDGGLLTPDNCAVVFIDHQPQMTFGVANIERQQLINNLAFWPKHPVSLMCQLS